MKRFLVVGCGGSGGITLQYVMDQLRADLGLYGIDTLPAGWQFVHVDVPGTPDGVGANLPPTVPAQGGVYVPISFAGATYPDVAANVEAKLMDSNQLARLVSWYPPPSRVNVPVQEGAGQYRAVGRILMLNRLTQTREQLDIAWSNLMDGDAVAELAAVARAISPATAQNVTDQPLVLVVSSMSGGAGASMTLDVCRLLATIPGIDGERIALFLYTSEVFGGLDENKRSGVEANGAAMMGELIAAQLGAGAADDIALMTALGIEVADRAAPPFGRVIPIGSRIGGSGERFAEGDYKAICRGLGRGLAALMLSGVASREFAGSDLANAENVTTDITTLGWGSDPGRLVWGAFGFASLGLGRERYGHYAAQRLARQAVNRLAAGHYDQRDPRPPEEQVAARVEQLWPLVRTAMGLPESMRGLPSWFERYIPARRFEASAWSLVNAYIAPWLQLDAPNEVRVWYPAAAHQITLARDPLEAGVKQMAYAWAHEWYLRLRRSIETEVGKVIAVSGLATGRAVLDRLIAESASWADGLRDAASRGPRDVTAPPQDAVAQLQALGRGTIASQHPLLEVLRRGHQQVLVNAARAYAAYLASSILASMRTDLATPMAAACTDLLRALESARAASPTETGQARSKTLEYSAWPAGGPKVPSRFAQAHNDVLLTPAEEFEQQFQAHVALSVPDRPIEDGIAEIVSMILHGTWPTSGKPVEYTNFSPIVVWRPAVLPEDPADQGRGLPHPMRVGQYRVQLSPGDVLERCRNYIGEPDGPFGRFVRQSLREYLEEPGLGDDERTQRERQVRESFSGALALARPLVGLNPNTVAQVHAGAPMLYTYKFSAIPLGGLQLADAIRGDLVQANNRILPTTVGRYDDAVRAGDNSRATRIDIFGAYRNTSPAAFTSLLEPIAKRWAASNVENARRNFWTWRRSRRLPGALPMGDEQRAACIGGWFVARLTGLLRFPQEHPGNTVDIWNDVTGTWLPFPQPRLTSRLQEPVDLLPAVLETMIIAMAQCHRSPDLAPLLPYRKLREIYDSDPATPTGNALATTGPTIFEPVTDGRLAAQQHLERWFRTGSSPNGWTPSAQAGSPSDTPEERQKKTVDSLHAYRETLGREFLARGDLGAPGGGRYSVVQRYTISSFPLGHELAADVYRVLGAVVSLAEGIVLDEVSRGSSSSLGGF